MKPRVIVAAACILLLWSMPVALAQDDVSPPGLTRALEAKGYDREFVDILTREEKLALNRLGRLTESELDTYLVEAGFPQEVIDVYEYAQKVEIYLLQAEYVGHHQGYGPLTGDGEGIGIRYIANFSETISILQFSDPNPGYVCYQLTYNWWWNKRPLTALTDKIGMSWEHNGWIIQENSWRRCYVAEGSSNHYFYSNNFSDIQVFGMGWSHDLRWYVGLDSIQSHRGWGRVRVHQHQKYIGDFLPTEVLGRYFHKILGPESRLIFSTQPDIDIYASYRYDASGSVSAVWHCFGN